MKRLIFLIAASLLAAFASVRADEAPPALKFLMEALNGTEDAETQANLLRGINKALEGRRGLTAPPEWERLAAKLGQSASAEVREQVQTLGVTFGSTGALAAMRKMLVDPTADRAAREKALESLLAAKDKETLPLVLDLAKSPGPLRRASLRGLSSYDDPRIAPAIIAAYPLLGTEEKREALDSLLARAETARALVGAVESKQIPITDINAPYIRHLARFQDSAIEQWLRANPALTITASNKQAEIARYKKILTPDFLKAGDPHSGRAFYSQSCALCHRLFDTGADLGPELTGSNRTDVDYLLQNILDPNALIGKDYQSTSIETTDGRILVGMVRGEDANAITLKTLADAVVVPRGDVKKVTVSEVSMMPEGLISVLTPDQVRDLFAYLASPRQVPVLATALNAADFFNGRDFTRWRASGEAWRISDGAIVVRGNANQPEALVSEMIAADFKLRAQIKLTGANAVAEIVLRGSGGPEGFRGASLSVGGASASNVWLYQGAKPQPVANGPTTEAGKWIACEIESRGPKISVRLDGKNVVEIPVPDAAMRTVPAIHFFGEGAELTVKDLKFEVAPAAP